MASLCSLGDYVGDMVLFRDLNIVDPRLPRYADAAAALGLAGAARPRKQEPAYARLVGWLLERARELGAPGARLGEIVYLGDTALADGNAFRNLRREMGWDGWCFIGSERGGELSVSTEDGVYAASRWSALVPFVAWARGQGARLDTATAVIVDIDKTALGARGRNDRSIDRARLEAMEALLREILGNSYDPVAFQQDYARFNVPRFHPFTADNQDYLAYICLMLNAGVCGAQALEDDVVARRVREFPEFLALVESRRASLASEALCRIHDDVRERVMAGDATPFKAFRRREYRETVGRMGHLPDDAPLERRLAEEICLTQEVVDLLAWLRGRGCLLCALSDKPDEASLPTFETAKEGYLPLHRTPTHVVGTPITALLE